MFSLFNLIVDKGQCTTDASTSLNLSNLKSRFKEILEDEQKKILEN